MSLTAPSRRGDLEASLKINIEASGMQTNKPNCVTTSFTGTPRWRNKRRVVEIHSSLVVLLLKFGSKLGESDLTSFWVTFLRKPLHSQRRAMARPKFIVLGFPEQGIILSLGFTAFAASEFPFYDYNTPSLSLFPYVLQMGCCFSNFTEGVQRRPFCFTVSCGSALMMWKENTADKKREQKREKQGRKRR